MFPTPLEITAVEHVYMYVYTLFTGQRHAEHLALDPRCSHHASFSTLVSSCGFVAVRPGSVCPDRKYRESGRSRTMESGTAGENDEWYHRWPSSG